MKIKDCYKQMAHEGRVQLWNIATNFVVVIITFWIGLSIQYIVYNHNEDETRKLAHYQIIDRFYPAYEKLLVKGGSFLGELLNAYKSKGSQNEELLKAVISNKNEIIDITNFSIDLMSRCRVYLEASKASAVSYHNGIALLGVKMITLVHEKGNNKNISIKDSLQSFVNSSFYIKATGEITGQEILAKCEELIQQSLDSEKISELENQIYMRCIVPSLLSNILMLRQEMQPNNSTYLRTIGICLSFLIVSLIIGFSLFKLLVKKLFSGEDTRLISQKKVESLNGQLKQAKDEISVLKAALHSKDDEIDMHQGTINRLQKKLQEK